MGAAETLVAECEARLAPLDAAANRAWWDANTDTSGATERARADAELALSDALADRAMHDDLTGAAAATDPASPAGRAVELLRLATVAHQADPGLRRRIIDLQSSVESRFAGHRGEIDGRPADDNAIHDILRTATDPERRRAAWEASKSVGAAVADDVRQLARLRNDAARELGFRDHFAMALATTEFDERRLFRTLEQVDEITREPFARLKDELDSVLAARFGTDRDALRPWHYDDPFFQEAPHALGVDLDPLLGGADLPALTDATFAGIGIDVAPALAVSDLLPRPGKNQHAFCIDIDRAGDVRVLANCEPGAYWAETMLHEFGHAAYDLGVDPALPWSLRTMHMCVTEGVAMRTGRLVHDADWLHVVAGAPARAVAEAAPRLGEYRRAELLVFARWVLVMTHFERGLYANPDGPHDRRWWDLVERYQLVRRPDDRDAPDCAAKIHVAVAPCYYHNYLYGELIASQLARAAGPLVDAPDAGRFLSDRVFAPGASLRWDRLVEAATGAPLTAAVLAAELTG